MKRDNNLVVVKVVMEICRRKARGIRTEKKTLNNDMKIVGVSAIEVGY